MKLSANFLCLFAALIAVTPAQVAAADGDGDGDDNGGSDVGNSNWKPQSPRPSPLYHDRPNRPDYPDHPGQPYDGKNPYDGKPDYRGKRPWNSGNKGTQVLWGQCTSLSLRVSSFAIYCRGFLTMVSRRLCLGGGYYYYGTNKCPEGSYCRYFSDCKLPFRFFVPPFFSPLSEPTLALSLLHPFRYHLVPF